MKGYDKCLSLALVLQLLHRCQGGYPIFEVDKGLTLPQENHVRASRNRIDFLSIGRDKHLRSAKRGIRRRNRDAVDFESEFFQNPDLARQLATKGNPSPTEAPSNFSIDLTAASIVPSDQPSLVPSDQPSLVPSDQPSLMPSDQPSSSIAGATTLEPSTMPGPITQQPSTMPGPTTPQPSSTTGATTLQPSTATGATTLQPSTATGATTPQPSTIPEQPALPTNGTIGCEDSPRDEYLSLRLSQVTELQTLLNTGTPQGRAFQYLLADSSLDLCNTTKLEQKYFLATMYYATQGDEWITNTGWLEKPNECEWYQVLCNDMSDVVELTLGKDFPSGRFPISLCVSHKPLFYTTSVNNALNGTIPEEVKALTALEVMDISQNYLSGTIPIGMESLPGNLQSIRLARNNLEGMIPEGLANMPFLRELVVRTAPIIACYFASPCRILQLIPAFR
jgi:hypothetical protein